MEKISVTRALAELKLLDKRITKAISDGKFVSYSINGKNAINTFKPLEEKQSIEALITRRAALKAAIMKSNATTKVNIGGVEMLVIDAIEMKETIKYKQSFLQQLKQQQQSTKYSISSTNETVSSRLDKLLEANFGKDSKTKSEEMEAIAKPFLERNEAKLEDPLNLDSLIESLSEEILVFTSNVDYALSESNALTQIEI